MDVKLSSYVSTDPPFFTGRHSLHQLRRHKNTDPSYRKVKFSTIGQVQAVSPICRRHARKASYFLVKLISPML